MAKNHIERSGLKDLRQLGNVAVFDGDLVAYSGIHDSPFRQR